MRRRAFGFIAGLAGLVALLQPGAAAGGILSTIGRAVFGHADELAEAGRAASLAGKLGRVESNLGRALTSAEARSIENAYQRVTVASLTGNARLPMQTFDRLMAVSRLERSNWGESIALADDLPNVRIRFPGNVAGADEALRLFTETRLSEVLDAPFDVANVRVVVAGLADDAAASANELAAFRRTIPAANFDDVGYLARLDGAGLSHQEMLARLRPYEGKTVIVVGHVPDGTSDFFVRLASGKTRQLQIANWIEAAEEAGVNLIPIGCHSEKLGPIGARGLLNSRDIRRALRATIESAPKTGKDFLRALTSDGKLELVIDPFEANLISNGIKIRNRQTRELVASLGLNGLRGARGAYNLAARDASVIERQNLGACLAAGSPTAFDTCVSDRVAAERWARDRYLADCRDKNRKLQPVLFQRASEKARIAHIVHGMWLAAFAGCALLLAWMAAVSSAARSDEQDQGTSLRHIFNRWRAAQFTHTALLISRGDDGNVWSRRIAIYLLAAIAAAFLSLGIWQPPETTVLVLFGIFCLTGLMLFGTVLEYGKKALVQGSLVDFLVALAAGGLTLTAYLEFDARDRAYQASAHANDMQASTFMETYANAKSEVCTPLSEDFDGTLQLPPPISVSPP